MALEMRLLQKQSQRLILSPQMQQAIYLLQLPMMDLKNLIEQEMVENPVLEEIKSDETSPEPSSAEESTNPTDTDPAALATDTLLEKLDDNWKDQFEDDVYVPPHRNAKESSELHDFFETLITKDTTLEEHLLSQFRLQDLTDEQRTIGEYIIGNLNEDGYLTISVEEIVQKTGGTPMDVEIILSQIQLFDPVGIASRNLAE